MSWPDALCSEVYCIWGECNHTSSLGSVSWFWPAGRTSGSQLSPLWWCPSACLSLRGLGLERPTQAPLALAWSGFPGLCHHLLPKCCLGWVSLGGVGVVLGVPPCGLLICVEEPCPASLGMRSIPLPQPLPVLSILSWRILATLCQVRNVAVSPMSSPPPGPNCFFAHLTLGEVHPAEWEGFQKLPPHSFTVYSYLYLLVFLVFWFLLIFLVMGWWGFMGSGQALIVQSQSIAYP